MMPRKSAFNFAKGKKQLSVPQHSATFLFVCFLVIASGASAAESTVRRAIGTAAQYRSSERVPTGEDDALPEAAFYFQHKEDSPGLLIPSPLAPALWPGDEPGRMAERWPKPEMPSPAKQHSTSGNSGSESPPCREGSPHRDGIWGRKLPVRPWSRSADRQTSNLGPAERILGPLRVPEVPMETLLVPPTNGWHWPCQGQGWRHRHGQGALSRRGACLPHTAGTSVHL